MTNIESPAPDPVTIVTKLADSSGGGSGQVKQYSLPHPPEEPGNPGKLPYLSRRSFLLLMLYCFLLRP